MRKNASTPLCGDAKVPEANPNEVALPDRSLAHVLPNNRSDRAVILNFFPEKTIFKSQVICHLPNDTEHKTVCLNVTPFVIAADCNDLGTENSEFIFSVKMKVHDLESNATDEVFFESKPMSYQPGSQVVFYQKNQPDYYITLKFRADLVGFNELTFLESQLQKALGFRKRKFFTISNYAYRWF